MFGAGNESQLLSVWRERDVTIEACARRKPLKLRDPTQTLRINLNLPKISDPIRDAFEIQRPAGRRPPEIEESNAGFAPLFFHLCADFALDGRATIYGRGQEFRFICL